MRISAGTPREINDHDLIRQIRRTKHETSVDTTKEITMTSLDKSGGQNMKTSDGTRREIKSK